MDLKNQSLSEVREILLPISSGTTQHFVDSDNMEGVNSHSDVEGILTTVLDQVLDKKKCKHV